MALDDTTHVDTFSVSTSAKQMGEMGGETSVLQMGSPVSRAQMGENDIIGSSLPETFAQTNRRQTPRQPQTSLRSSQMGGFVYSHQQMG